jgi:hydrogenase large subunit
MSHEPIHEPTSESEAEIERDVEPTEDVPSDVVDLTIDPVTRVSGGGGQAFHARVDLDENEVVEAQTRATLYRGYENVLDGRDPRDAVDLASRVCGDTGVVHSVTASMALEMALPVEPPPLGIWVRNMGQGAAVLYNLAGHLFLRAGPDYSAEMLSENNPAALERANDTRALNADVHGYETVGDIMSALDPLYGELYYETIQRARDVQELISLAYGKFPHPSTAAPGGVTTTLEKTTLTQYFSRLKDLADFAKTIPPLWDDLLDFMLEHVDGFEEVGERPVNLISTGLWDHPDHYNARYEDAEEWGRARLATPGVVVDGELKTTSLPVIDQGIEEFVANSYYDDWSGRGARFEESPTGATISPHHPWNKDTSPAPSDPSWEDPYSWATAPRWDRTPMETGAFARNYIAARAGEVDYDLIEATGDGLNLTLPEVARPEMTFRWEIPDRLNAAERLRAEAYHLAYGGIACYQGLVQTLESLKDGESHVHEPFEVPLSGTHRGVGFWESGRGCVTHHIVIENGSIDNYQILTPSTWMASPTDPFGNPGPIEEAATNTPLLETVVDRRDVTGIDIVRAIRSFDPCMLCTGH